MGFLGKALFSSEKSKSRLCLFAWRCGAFGQYAGMMELADVLDSKSSGGDTVRVRPPLPAPTLKIPQTLDMIGFAEFFYLYFYFFMCFTRIPADLLFVVFEKYRIKRIDRTDIAIADLSVNM